MRVLQTLQITFLFLYSVFVFRNISRTFLWKFLQRDESGREYVRERCLCGLIVQSVTTISALSHNCSSELDSDISTQAYRT